MKHFEVSTSKALRMRRAIYSRLLVCEGALGLGGIDYLLQCIVETEGDAAAVQWQGLLGRLYVLDQLIHERAMDFRATVRVESSATANVTTEPPDCYSRTFLVLRFVARHLSFPHAKAAKLAYRVFCQVAALQVVVGGMAVVDEVCQLLDSANTEIQWRIFRKLQSLAGDYVRDKARPSINAMPSADVDPVVFFVSAQPAPRMEVVPDSSKDADADVTSESTSHQLQSVVCSADDKSAHGVEARSPSEKRFVYDAAVVVSKQVMMTDTCVQTSPSLFRRSKITTAASSVDDTSDAELGASCRTTESFSLHTSDSAALLGSHGSASGSHGSTSGTTDDLTEFAKTPQSASEKVSFKNEVVLSPNDSLEQSEGMIIIVIILIRVIMFMVLSSWQATLRVHPVHMMNMEWRQELPTLSPGQTTWAVSLPVGCP